MFSWGGREERKIIIAGETKHSLNLTRPMWSKFRRDSGHTVVIVSPLTQWRSQISAITGALGGRGHVLSQGQL